MTEWVSLSISETGPTGLALRDQHDPAKITRPFSIPIIVSRIKYRLLRGT